MLPPGHFAAAYLAGEISGLFIPELSQPKYLLLISLFGIFPDFDGFIAFLKAKRLIWLPEINHREFKTHAPLLYLAVFIAWMLLFPKSNLAAWTFIAGTWTHFFIDTFSPEGIKWLYPFKTRSYSFNLDSKMQIEPDTFGKFWGKFLKTYFKLRMAKIELIIILISAAVLLTKYLHT